MGDETSQDCLCIGELLVDLCQTGVNDSGYPVYEANPGGAPANVAVALARWGRRCGFIGQVGDDALGRFLAATLRATGVACAGLRVSPRSTTVAVVSNGANGERSFDFLRGGAEDADWHLGEDQAELAGCRILHFGSVSLTAEPARSATLAAVRQAKAAGALVSFDPNLRPALWSSQDEARQWIWRGARLADVIKLSAEELRFLGDPGTEPLEAAMRAFHRQSGARLLFVTLGEGGCRWMNAGQWDAVPAPPVHPVDTTGAGDAFMAGILFSLSSPPRPLESLERDDLDRMARFANAAGALTTERRGGIPAIPTLDAIAAVLS